MIDPTAKLSVSRQALVLGISRGRVYYKARPVPWRDLPADFGNWNSVFRRFRRRAEGGVFERIFKEISGTPDFEYAMIDGTIVQAHQKASGAKGGLRNQAIGRSHGGLTTKIVALVDALGNLSNFVFLPGQAHDMKGVEPLIDGVAFDALWANKAFDADWLITELNARGATVDLSRFGAAPLIT